MTHPKKDLPTGPVPIALREWCYWIYTQSESAFRTAPAGAKAWDGSQATWLDYCGIKERQLIEAVMEANIWRPGT